MVHCIEENTLKSLLRLFNFYQRLEAYVAHKAWVSWTFCSFLSIFACRGRCDIQVLLSLLFTIIWSTRSSVAHWSFSCGLPSSNIRIFGRGEFCVGILPMSSYCDCWPCAQARSSQTILTVILIDAAQARDLRIYTVFLPRVLDLRLQSTIPATRARPAAKHTS